MDSAFYSRDSCTCDRTSDTFKCLGFIVECKPNGCPLPQSLEQGLTLYDSKGNRFSTSANPDAIPHGRALIFNCTPSGNQYNEPNGRTFACHKGSWIGKPLPGEEWSFNNNGSFPKCRPAVCKHACQNGGWCKATDTCECPERFKGAYCEISGCAKPEGNLVNLEKQFYDDGETIRITDLTCDRGYLPSSGDTTCKNGNWSDTISCVPAIVYKIRVVTADVRGAGTDGNVTIRLKGTAGNTGLIGLPGRFKQKNIDDIAKLLPDVGTVRFKY
ncbi:uncharacterized protein LOC127839814 [Dreissena polymorpha]|uniref:uncharacterized protein LOC127839814 n=1 Tax=Dreissena polymorpha TaxID=45954 RepID=UPI002263EA3E|nr:uncharacterized protein LOC127839814 [Dreissena polymorpha]